MTKYYFKLLSTTLLASIAVLLFVRGVDFAFWLVSQADDFAVLGGVGFFITCCFAIVAVFRILFTKNSETSEEKK